MRIGELAEACNCPVETIRYYEKINLLQAAPRLDNGYRSYDESHLKWLKFILHSRSLGFTQDETRRLTNIANQPVPPCSEVYSFLVDHVAEVRRKLTELKQLEKALLRLEARCEQGTLDECPVIDELMR